ncbi:DUF397 domain-containing protein [Streptomyces sp. SDr-06]|uniref:DUF397 domain-containing protein n=1 Tax=Streptomyces sp. SDr-06 TaxID=2267702 RepID=UPI000DEA461A|nr:DUF397 domain-containing protein [Streptomyces sp. SDr-06]RCH64756.1 DUF397 domain-containing protein [Streptomyces sp. SDr-06]
MSIGAQKWFKSSYSGSDGGECLEMACTWRKSSYSGSDGGQCVEVAAHPSAIHIRDSKDPEGPTLTLNPAAWQGFVAEL